MDPWRDVERTTKRPDTQKAPRLIGQVSDDAVSDETALIVDSIQTMAELLGRPMPRP